MTAYESTLLGQIDCRFRSNKHVKRILVAIAAIVMVVSVVQFVHKSTTPTSGYRESLYGVQSQGGDPTLQLQRTRGAFGRWMYDIRYSQQTDKDPYRDFWFPTPPLVLALLIPFASLPNWLGALLWAILKLAAVVAAIWLVFKAISRPDRPLPLGVGLIALLFGLRPLISDMQHGNINILVLLPLALTLYLWVSKRDLAAGVALGLAVALKLTPALLGLYYLYRRQWSVVVGLLIGLMVFGLVVPTAVFGPGKTIDYFQGWYGVMIEPVVVGGWVSFQAENQSLPGTVLRWLVASGATELERIDQDGMLKYGSMDLAQASEAWVRWLIKALQLGVVGALVWLCRTPLSNRKDPRAALEFALVLLAMLILSERTWKHHCVTFVIVYAAVWYGLTCFDWSVGYRGLFATGLGVQFALLSLSSRGILGESIADGLLHGGVVFVGIVLCFVQAAWLLRSRWEIPI